ncbi:MULTISPECIES: glycosyltransferase [Methylosinus]|nr:MULTISPECIES: glycosyltransferase [Methylosinus]OBS53888.1 hypothetical protein A8B73_03730 [Methylosinus sp. 3S-1]
MSGRRHLLQASAWYPPYDLGGTEIYLQGLVGELAERGVESVIVVPRPDGAPQRYRHEGACVETYPVSGAATAHELRRGAPHAGFEEFRTVLARHSGAIYHQHSWTRGCGPQHLRAAHELGLRTVVTVHVGGAFCLRGTMMLRGEGPCDGFIDERRCAGCWAESRGLPKPLAMRLASLPLGAARAARRFASPVATALSARALGAEKKRDLAEMIERADRIVAVCGWLRDALVANGAPEKKLVVSRQGVTRGFLANARANPRRPRSGRLELLYLGRWHWTKGVDVVVRAIAALPRSLDLRLTMRGPEGGAEERAYKADIRALVGDDPRFCFADAAPNARLPEIMALHDCLVVPSLWLETGPMVALEAQACGLFVLGSRLGGLAELLDGRGGGELVEAGSVEAWRDAILRLAERGAENNVLRETNEPRTMAAAAADMIALYDELAG